MQILFSALYQICNLIIQIYIFIVIARALVSWVNPDPYNPIVRFLYSATEPVLAKLRRYLPLQFGGFDLTPIALLIGLSVLQQVLYQLFFQLSRGF